MRVTQQDIARRMGISISLVSRALAGTADKIGVRESTVRRIRDTARRMGYVPNAVAQALRREQFRTLGVAVFDFDDPFFNALIARIHQGARQRSWYTALAGFERRHPTRRDVEPLLNMAVDALIVAGSGPSLRWTEPFRSRHVQVYQIGEGDGGAEIVNARLDTDRALQDILDHLYGLGHRRASFIGAACPVGSARGFQIERLCRERGIEMPLNWICLEPPPVFTCGYRGVRRLLRKISPEQRPTALICSSDTVAIGALRALREEGIRVPEDWSVTGLDDMPMSALCEPTLTTVRQPVDEMCDWVLKCIQLYQNQSPREKVFTGTLEVRASTGPAPGARIKRRRA